MEILIIICLLIIIFLLMQDKAVHIKKRTADRTTKLKKIKHTSIMDEPKQIIVSSDTIKLSKLKIEHEKGSVHSEVNESVENRSVQISDEDLDRVFAVQIDLEEEEEEWKKYGLTVDYANLAQGVTFEELNDAGRILKSEASESTQKEETVNLVSKIYGTELFSLLENSIDGASQKIAELLDKSLNAATQNDFSNFQKSDLNDFDIGQFI